MYSYIVLVLYFSVFLLGGLKWKVWQISLLAILLILLPPAWFLFAMPVHRLTRVPMLKLLNALVSHLYLIVALAWTCVTPFLEHFSTYEEKSTINLFI